MHLQNVTSSKNIWIDPSAVRLGLETRIVTGPEARSIDCKFITLHGIEVMLAGKLF